MQYSELVLPVSLFQVDVLPSTAGVKETFVGQFLKQLKLRALTLAKYVDAEP